jgi:uncharacterized protein
MTKGKNSYRIGVISDTHGKLASSAQNAFQKTDLIIHAGDIGSYDVLEQLKSIAPTVAVSGNMDFAPDVINLNKTETIQVGNTAIHIRHILNNTNTIPESANIDVVIFGHTHRQEAEWVGSTLFLNPGSAGQRRYGNPLSVALLMIKGKDVTFKFIDL